MKHSSRTEIALYLPAVMALGILLFSLWPHGGHLGHDYYHFFTRLYLGAIHFWKNGLSVPHYTASLCGGVPFFADPQSVYYSLPQWLSFVMDPMWATLLTYVVFYSLGYWGMLTWLREARIHIAVAHLAGIAFLLSGFAFAHLYVGHVTHHGFLLFPWLAVWLSRVRSVRDRQFFADVSMISLTLLYTFYSGGVHILIVYLVMLFLWGPALFGSQPSRQGKIRWLEVVMLSAGLFLLGGAGKLAASYRYAAHFVPAEIDGSGIGRAYLLVQYFWFDPKVTPPFLRFGQWAFGPWEYVGFFSLLGVVGTLWVLLRNLFRITPLRFFVTAWALLAGLFIIDIASAGRWNASLPLVKKYHNPIKIFAAFIPFLLFVSAGFLNAITEPLLKFLPTKAVRVFLFLGFAAFLMMEFAFSARLFFGNRLALGFLHQTEIFRALREGRENDIGSVTREYNADLKSLATGCTSLKCYEPVFGYRHQTLRAELTEGPTSEVTDGKFNLTHPGCLLYPEFFRCRPWDRIDATDRANFYRFISRRDPEWGVPPWQMFLLWLSGGTCLGVLGLRLVLAGLPRWEPASPEGVTS